MSKETSLLHLVTPGMPGAILSCSKQVLSTTFERYNLGLRTWEACILLEIQASALSVLQ